MEASEEAFCLAMSIVTWGSVIGYDLAPLVRGYRSAKRRSGEVMPGRMTDLLNELERFANEDYPELAGKIALLRQSYFA